MNEELNRTDLIIADIEKNLNNGIPLSPDMYFEYAVRLNILYQGENDAYAEVYRESHKIMYESIKEGKSAAEAEAKMKASDVYSLVLRQKGRVSQVEEFIRLAKIRCQMVDREYKQSIE